ncbi:MAG: sigma-70 family RNA polymerase sigma factor [Actinomycetota bacterium]|nr:sigma-70 family RNA polymerase sigma factor [Actinomycetota bacterium]
MGRSSLGLGDRQLDELVSEAQRDPHGDSPAMREIVRRFDLLAVKIASGMTADPYLRDELANSARVGLIAAVRRHDTSRAGFPAYARRFMRGAALRAWKRSRSWGRGGSDITVTVTDFTDPTSEPLVPRVNPLAEDSPWGDSSTATAIAALSPTQQKLLFCRYADDRSLAEIGAQTGTTVSAVRQRLDTAHRAVARQLVAA